MNVALFIEPIAYEQNHMLLVSLFLSFNNLLSVFAMFLNGINSEHLFLSLVFLLNELVFTHLSFFIYVANEQTFLIILMS